MPGKKRIGSVHTAKNGRKYKITSKGARFIKTKTRTKKGGSVRVGGRLKTRRKRKGAGFLGDVGRDIQRHYNYLVRDTLK